MWRHGNDWLRQFLVTLSRLSCNVKEVDEAFRDLTNALVAPIFPKGNLLLIILQGLLALETLDRPSLGAPLHM